MTPYSFARSNRNLRTLAILAGVYAALLALVVLFDAAWWIAGLLSLATLPALWDVPGSREWYRQDLLLSFVRFAPSSCPLASHFRTTAIPAVSRRPQCAPRSPAEPAAN